MALEKTTLVAVSARPDSKIILSNTDEVYPDYLTAMDQIKYV